MTDTPFACLAWLRPLAAFPEPFRARLALARGLEAPAARLAAFAGLADARLGLLETVQLDTALTRTLSESGADPRAAGLEPVRVALLASATADHLLPALRVAGLRRGLAVTARAGAYGQYRRELVDPSDPAGLRAFGPDGVILALAARDFLGAVPVDAPAEAAEAAVTTAVAELRALWARGRALGATVVQQSFLDLSPSVFGGLDAVVPGAPARLVARLNAAAADAAAAEGVLWLDVTRGAARDGLGRWHDPVRWLQAKMEIAPDAAGAWGELAARLVAAARGRSRKCLVLDLDNTLWGGVIGDDGLEGIVIGEGSGAGEAHLALQRHAKALRARGVLLAVCSKNEAAIAEAAFRDHPEMALGRDDFAAFTANWTDKATNLEGIAKSLNIGLDARVFVDDNPEFLRMAARALRMAFCLAPLMAFMIVIPGILSALGEVRYNLILSLGIQVLVQIPALLILPRFFGVDGVWMSFPLVDVIASSLSAFLLWKSFKQRGLLESGTSQ